MTEPISSRESRRRRPFKLKVRLASRDWNATRSFATDTARDEKAAFYRRSGWEVVTWEDFR